MENKAARHKEQIDVFFHCSFIRGHIMARCLPRSWAAVSKKQQIGDVRTLAAWSPRQQALLVLIISTRDGMFGESLRDDRLPGTCGGMLSGLLEEDIRTIGSAVVRASLFDAKHSFRAHERWLAELVGKPARAEGIDGYIAHKIAHGAAHKFRHPYVCCVARVLAVRCLHAAFRIAARRGSWQAEQATLPG